MTTPSARRRNSAGPRTYTVLPQSIEVDVGGFATELVEALAKRQDKNGSWVNPADRFMEGDANLVTAYALLALNYAR